MPKYGSKSPPPEFTQAQLDYVDPDRPKLPQVRRWLWTWPAAREEERRLREEEKVNHEIEMMAIEDKIRWRNQDLERQRQRMMQDGRRSNNYHQPLPPFPFKLSNVVPKKPI